MRARAERLSDSGVRAVAGRRVARRSGGRASVVEQVRQAFGRDWLAAVIGVGWGGLMPIAAFAVSHDQGGMLEVVS